MSLIESLAKECLVDEYFIDLFGKLERKAAYNLFKLDDEKLTNKEYVDILRFGDMLSRSKDPEALNKAFKIISLLVHEYSEDELFQSFAQSIFIKMGNFPALKYLESHLDSIADIPLDVVLSRSIKEEFQKIPNTEFVFTDSQYEIFEKLKNSNHFSFSGPTSLGKSFIINTFIRHLISEHKASDNIAILVPTRALINQTVVQLKKEFSDIDNYKILAYPKVPTSFKLENNKFIFVYTPERLVAYLANGDNPKLDYLFIDEAHKIIAPKDSRSPLYYHAILQAERKSVKLFFASPNIPNPDVFLKIFEKSTEENINVKNSPVSQNRYYLDFIEKKSCYFSEFGEKSDIPFSFDNIDFNSFLKEFSDLEKSIIYCNSKSDTVTRAIEFANTLPDKNSKDIDELIKLTKEYLHKDYYLIDCLKKGVAFHFGNLPQKIREKVEILFSKERCIDYLFCTSTLLEGVNLPAKNIFILSNAIGTTKFSDIDFWNLAGRAGRMTKELSGNIICTRIEDKQNRWNKPDSDLKVVQSKEIKEINSILISGASNFYKNIEASINGEAFTNKNASSSQVEVWNHYANIVRVHEIMGYDSTLRANFLSKIPSAKDTLKNDSESIVVPEKILTSSSMIKAKYQNDIFLKARDELMTIPVNFNYDNCLAVLNYLCDLYAWEEEESSGRKPMCKSREVLRYYAVILTSWIDSTPLSLMISNALKHYSEKGVIWNNEFNQNESFDIHNKRHINMVINDLIYDIDNVLRFKLKNYFENYFNLIKEKHGSEFAGENIAEFLEYGTVDHRIIELQNIGFSRHLATFLMEEFQEYLLFEGNDLIHIKAHDILVHLQKESAEYQELIEVYGY